MILITDSNIVFSAIFYPNSIIAKIFDDKSNIQFIAPDYLIDEILKHYRKISDDKDSVKQKLELILTKIKIIDTKIIPKKYILEANELVKNIDEYDALFIAVHLYKKHKIWTGDKRLINGLKSIGFDICITTAELKTKLYKK